MFDGSALGVAVVASDNWRVRRRFVQPVRTDKPFAGTARKHAAAAAEPSSVAQRQCPMVRTDLAAGWLTHRQSDWLSTLLRHLIPESAANKN